MGFISRPGEGTFHQPLVCLTLKNLRIFMIYIPTTALESREWLGCSNLFSKNRQMCFHRDGLSIELGSRVQGDHLDDTLRSRDTLEWKNGCSRDGAGTDMENILENQKEVEVSENGDSPIYPPF